MNWTITIERDLNDVPLFENPDTRGPCGGKSPAIPTTGAVGRAFESREAQIVELLVPWSSETATFLAAQQQDRDVVPCGPFTSITNQGIEQRATNVHVVRMPKHPSAVVAFADISVQDQQATMGLVSTRTGKYLALVMIIGSRASDSAARALVDKLTTAKP